MAALPLRTVLRWEPYAAARRVSEVARSGRGFVRALEAAGSVRALPPEWQRERANFIARHTAQIVASGDLWLSPAGLPTDHALAVLMWAHWPDRHRSDLRTAAAALKAWERGDRSPRGKSSLKTDLDLFLSRCCARRS